MFEFIWESIDSNSGCIRFEYWLQINSVQLLGVDGMVQKMCNSIVLILRSEQNDLHFTDIFKMFFFFKEFFFLLLKFNWSLLLSVSKFVLVQLIMAWHQAGNKPLSELMRTQHWHIYASTGLSELTHWGQDKKTPFRRRHFLMQSL